MGEGVKTAAAVMVRVDDDEGDGALDGGGDGDSYGATSAVVLDEGDDDKAEDATAGAANANDKADGNDEVEALDAATELWLWLSCDVEEEGAVSSADSKAVDVADDCDDDGNEYEIDVDDAEGDGIETAMLVDDGISADVAVAAADAFDEMYFNNRTIAECSSLS